MNLNDDELRLEIYLHTRQSLSFYSIDYIHISLERLDKLLFNNPLEAKEKLDSLSNTTIMNLIALLEDNIEEHQSSLSKNYAYLAIMISIVTLIRPKELYISEEIFAGVIYSFFTFFLFAFIQLDLKRRSKRKVYIRVLSHLRSYLNSKSFS
ncbi:hypothetical protein [Alkalicoccobacillus gibsonii]|uniref:hypothetical protein n=1 Tax=Alkalicoccobacillus gibsonii TaxID=79881 RepID=UPI001933B73C|nr:hypothetical protein [Alkalicoccobacillus gibsonii]MBM0064791.1 hypothetical protein [Alkalicoccobacillus gibsonii]